MTGLAGGVGADVFAEEREAEFVGEGLGQHGGRPGVEKEAASLAVDGGGELEFPGDAGERQIAARGQPLHLKRGHEQRADIGVLTKERQTEEQRDEEQA